MMRDRRCLLICLLLLACCYAVAFAQDTSSPLSGWQKVWEFALTEDTISSALVDIGGEEGWRLVTLHSGPAKEDEEIQHIRFWKRAGDAWRTEWETTLDVSEMRSMIAGYFVKGARTPQVLTARNLILPVSAGYEKRVRADEVNWFGYASLSDGTDIPIAAFPGGVWKGVVSPDARNEWLRFERVEANQLLSLPQRFGEADWVVLNVPFSLNDPEAKEWTQQGFVRVLAQLGRRMHPDQPLVVSKREGEKGESIALVAAPTLSSPLRVLWQSEPLGGIIREARLVSAPKLRGGLLVLVGGERGFRVQFWQILRRGSSP